MAARIDGGKSICRNNICPEERYRFLKGGGVRSLTGGARGGAERRAKRTRGRINFPRHAEQRASLRALFTSATIFNRLSYPLCCSLLFLSPSSSSSSLLREPAREIARTDLPVTRDPRYDPQYASLQGYIRHVSSLSFFLLFLSPPPPSILRLCFSLVRRGG